ncbi:MAG: PilZ domain-containing protein [Porticoccaceae bacterium]
MNSDNARGAGTLTLEIHDRVELHRHYMSFVDRGALFVPTQRVYQMADNVRFVLSVYLLPEPETITGDVVWLAGCGFGSGRRPGVGVRLSRQQASLKAQIEQVLMDMLWSDYPTLTM